jgi:serine/threonine protein kinase
MEFTVESLCNQVARNRLLAPEAVRALRQRWRDEARAAADDAGRFSQWLIAGGHLTDFQLGMLTRGFADLLFLGDYKLLDRIGQGRMAGVYKAVHATSGQIVAVKVLPPSKAKLPSLLARFQRESRLAVRLKHPNVVRTFQVGKTRGDLNYLVMEYLDGETLEDVLARRKRLPAGEAVHVMLQALRGLQHLDDESVVHRDLKAGNLMLVPARAKDQPDTVLPQTVKILDIGLGRALFDEGEPGADDAGELTNEGVLLGTPGYMAPEQARKAHAADVRSDLYSLGCVFYEMLTGQVPFPDNNLIRQMVRHATEPVKPLRQLNPAVPEPFQAVLDRLLAKDPAQRYATASQAVKAVQALLPQQPEPPAAPEPPPQMKKYLTWLETASRDAAEAPATATAAPPTVPAPAPQPPKPPVAAPATMAAPRPVVAAAPAKPAAAPAKPAAAVPVAPVTLTAQTAPPKPNAPAAPPLAPAARAPADKPLWHALFRPNRRDLMFAGVGAGLLLVLELIVWIVVLITK